MFDGSNSSVDYAAITVTHYPTYMPNPVGVMIYNNTIFRSDAANDNNSGIIIHSGARGTIVRNNLISFPNVSGPVSVVSNNGQETKLSNNLRLDNAMFVNPLATDPLLRDFGLQNGSGAQNAGIQVPVFDDYLGISRQQVQQYDVGAYEK